MTLKIRAVVVLSTLALSALACNLPLLRQAAPQPTLPFEMTMTAVYATLEGHLAAGTPTPYIITATPAPTDTATPAPTPTATYTSTATSTAIPTQTGVPRRSGALISAPYLYTAPVLDGVWDEWGTAAYPATFITYGGGQWSGSDDLEGSYRIGWNTQYLYLAVKVKDDFYVQNASGPDLYQGDSIEILLDTDLYGDFYYNVLSPDDYQLGISPGNPDPAGTREAYLWYPANLAGGRSQVQIAAVRSEGVYRVESAIPWSVFNASPYAGKHFGFALSISDDDLAGSTIQQSLASSAQGRSLLQPTTWGELVLTQ
ncbi:MAG: hypothetical protein GYA17_13095 [Chloroflexi bacterium]|nr:sugar-binding protein [Anaerolineaceae bacterium]NMB89290.1 hypothetical protein [Chloroflexota bacterium]